MQPSPILAPAAVLVLWTVIVFYWMMATRLPAMKAAGIQMGSLTGSKGSDADRALPPKAQWKAHNYNHLMEQPTAFYAAVFIIALTGTGDGVNLWLAWGYVGLRIAHSLWQALVNTVTVRFTLFMLASLCLTALALHAAMAAF